jgi:Spy/CpxP family protein refolding chaperone
MSRKHSLILVAAAALMGSASTAIAQGPPAGGPGRMRSAVAIVLENKDTLALTAEQVSKIEEIRKAAEVKNQPIIEKMRAARESGAGMEGAREIMAEARKNDEEAFNAALALLTDAQKTKAQEIVTKAREAMRGRRPGSRS